MYSKMSKYLYQLYEQKNLPRVIKKGLRNYDNEIKHQGFKMLFINFTVKVFLKLRA